MAKKKKTIKRIMEQIDSLTKAGNMEAVNQLIDIVDRMTKDATEVTESTGGSGKYMWARVLTLQDGSKHYHPLICDDMPSANKEDYRMDAYDDILDLQENEKLNSYISVLRQNGYNMAILFVSDAVYADLEKKLDELLTGVWEHLGNAANEMTIARTLMGIESVAEEAMREQVNTLFGNEPIVAGIGVDKDRAIVNRADYIDEEVEPRDRESEDEDEGEECESIDCESIDCGKNEDGVCCCHRNCEDCY